MRRESTKTLLTIVGLSLLMLWMLTLSLTAQVAAVGPPLAVESVPPRQLLLTPTVTITAPSLVTVTPPEATATPTPTLTATSTPTPTATSTTAPVPTLTGTPEPLPPTPSPTATAGGFWTWPLENPLLFAGGTVAVLALLFVGLLILLFGRKKRRQPARTGTRPITPVGPAASPVAPAPARLVCADAEGKPKTFVLAPEGVAVGRAAENQLVIGPTFPGWESVSQHHARIFKKGEDWMVTDLNSTNGVYVNERRTGRNLLRDGWKLRLGGVVFTFRAGKEA